MNTNKVQTRIWLVLVILGSVILFVRVFDFILWDGEWWQMVSAFVILLCAAIAYKRARASADNSETDNSGKKA